VYIYSGPDVIIKSWMIQAEVGLVCPSVWLHTPGHQYAAILPWVYVRPVDYGLTFKFGVVYVGLSGEKQLPGTCDDGLELKEGGEVRGVGCLYQLYSKEKQFTWLQRR